MLCSNALLSASHPLLFTSFTYVLASGIQLYMSQVFTHCLPTITCVSLMSIVCVCTIKQLFYVVFYVYYSLPFIYYFCKCFFVTTFLLLTVFVYIFFVVCCICCDSLCCAYHVATSTAFLGSGYRTFHES